jgi:FlaA1/EpsC-like NDP-sugar epimerase
LPGEKLFEELALGEEDVLKTEHPRIFIGKVKSASLVRISTMIDEISELATGPDVGKIFTKFKEIVPEYQTTVVRQDVDSETVFRGPHKHGTPACSS